MELQRGLRLRLRAEDRGDNLARARREDREQGVAEAVRGLVAALQPDTGVGADGARPEAHAVVPADGPLFG